MSAARRRLDEEPRPRSAVGARLARERRLAFAPAGVLEPLNRDGGANVISLPTTPVLPERVFLQRSGPPSRLRLFLAASLAGHALLLGALLLGAFLLSWPPRDLPETGGEAAIPVEFIVVAPDNADHAEAGAAPAQVVVDLPDAPEAVTVALPPVAVPAPDEPPSPSLPERPPMGPQPDPTVGSRDRERQAALAEARAERARAADQQASRQRERRQRQAARAEPTAQSAPLAPAAAPGTGQSAQSTSAAQRGGATGGAATSAGAADIASYRARVLAHLARFKQYPDAAQERDIAGRATVAFTLTRSGGVTTVALAGSSGAGVLDQAALAMVRRAQPFPAMPAGGPASMSFTAAIRYDLR